MTCNASVVKCQAKKKTKQNKNEQNKVPIDIIMHQSLYKEYFAVCCKPFAVSSSVIASYFGFIRNATFNHTCAHRVTDMLYHTGQTEY